MTERTTEEQHRPADRTRIGRRLAQGTGLLIVGGFVVYCIVRRRELAVVFDVEAAPLAGIVALALVRRVFAAGRFRALCRPYGANVPLAEAYLLVLVAEAVNLVLPLRGGFAARAVYLKKRHGVHLSYMPSLAIGSTILSFLVGGALMLIANTVWSLSGKTTIWPLWALAAILCVPVLAFMITPPSFLLNRSGAVGHKLRLASEGWNLLRSDHRSLALACGFHLAAFVVTGGIVALAFQAVHVPLSLPVAVCIAVVNSYAGIANLTPSNLGVQEWTIGILGSLSSLDFDTGVAAALIMRAVGATISLLGGALGYYVLFVRPARRRATNGR